MINVVIPVVYQGQDANFSAARTADTAAYLRRALATLEPGKKRRRVSGTVSSSEGGPAGVAIAIAEGALVEEGVEAPQDADNEDATSQITGMMSNHQIGPAPAAPQIPSCSAAGARPTCPVDVPPELITWLSTAVSIPYARGLEAYLSGQDPDTHGIGPPMVPADGDDCLGQAETGESASPVLASEMAQSIIEAMTTVLSGSGVLAAEAGGTHTAEAAATAPVPEDGANALA